MAASRPKVGALPLAGDRYGACDSRQTYRNLSLAVLTLFSMVAASTLIGKQSPVMLRALAFLVGRALQKYQVGLK